MASKEKEIQIKPPPPATLSKELLGVWSAWSRMGDREVVREAAAKGLHVEWAYIFISVRKNLELIIAENWFKEEVFFWIQELLSRKQIFKASHILSNINLDPTEEFTKIFLETHNRELRDYLGCYLLKSEKLEPIHRSVWNLLQIINDKHEFLLDLNSEEIKKLNVHSVYNQTYEWKSNIGTQLFFNTFDVTVRPFVTSSCAWKFLIRNNIEFLRLWINIYFNKKATFKTLRINPQIFGHLKQLFQQLRITEEMINSITDRDFDVPEETQQMVLNELSQFGIFHDMEKNDLIKILSRLADNNSLNCLYNILDQHGTTITLYQFYQLLLDYCIKNNLHAVLNWCNIDFKLCSDLIKDCNTKILNFMYYLVEESNLHHEVGVGENIFKVSKFLMDDLDTYFISNPLIPLSLLMLLHPNLDLLELFKMDKIDIIVENFNITSEILNNVQKALPFLNGILTKSVSSPYSITLYDLLEMHGNLRKSFFNFRQENIAIPNFNSSYLIEKYGYRKKINYIFYLKQLRPSYISETLIKDEFKTVDRYTLVQKVYKISFQKFCNKQLAAGCIAFLEMIGENSLELRIHIKAANIICESQSFALENISDLLDNVYLYPERFVNALEEVLINDCALSADCSGAHLIEEIKKHKIIVEFSRVHNLNLPEQFLKYCARNDLWLPFVLYVQIYNYPSSQAQKLLQHFQNYNLIEHLKHAFSHDIQIDEQKNLLMRDSRTYYLSRIGVKKTIDTSFENMCSSVSSFGSHTSTGSSISTYDLFDNEYLDFKTDLLEILLKCHNSVDPPKSLLYACYLYKSPIFAVLATSYEPDSIITNWLMWLSMSCGIEREFSRVEGLSINAAEISDLLVCALKNGYGRVVYNSFQIFIPNNPLKIIVEFLINCIDLNFDHDFLTEKLKLFQKSVKQRKSSILILDVDEMMCLCNKTWLETTALMLVTTALQCNFQSQYSQLKYLRFLHDIQIANYFSIKCPNFLNYFYILNYLFQSKCDIKLDLSVIYNNEIIEKELRRCVQALISAKCYEYAFKIAQQQDISTDFIITTEWYDKFKSCSNNKNFWEECNCKFIEAHVQGSIAVEFYENCSTKTVDKTEQYNILNIAYKWALANNLENLYDIEKKKWIAYFNADTNFVSHSFEPDNHVHVLYTEMKQELDTLQFDDDIESTILNDEHFLVLNSTVESLLTSCNFWEALKLTKIFQYKHNDVELIELCYCLAEGLISPHQMSNEQRQLLFKSGNIKTLPYRRPRTLTSSSSRLLSGSHSSITSAAAAVPSSSEFSELYYQDTLSILEFLTDHIKNGSKIIYNILITYRISVNIDKKYVDVFRCVDPMKMLKDALNEDCNNQLEVVYDFCTLFNWSAEEISDFVCEQLINTINDYLKSKLEPILLWKHKLDADFHLVLQLLVDNCSNLGLKLYSYASTLLKSQTQLTSAYKISEISLIIELLIRSHDCFTADCNMEGISTILRKCQSIVPLLLTLKSWKLIVRLLTGVARYTEMNYVFHILRENEQFELLLRKGSRKDNGLKIALLKYLKKYCPEDRQLYEMVALHFTLFSEIAQLWEDEAKSIIRNLIEISKLEMQNNGLNSETEPYVLFSNTEGTKVCLNKAMTNYIHATDYHIQGEKLTKAMDAAKQAELLALQRSTVNAVANNSTTICFLNISDEQITSLIIMELSFPQSLILIEANNYKADWSSVLFEQFVIQNNTNYLDNFLGSFPLTDSLMNDISQKFLSLNAINDRITKNMKEILVKCNSVHTKYRIASELGFSDLIEDLLTGNQLAYLKDTVWKKGYKS